MPPRNRTGRLEPAKIPDDALWLLDGRLLVGSVELLSREEGDDADGARAEAVLATAFKRRLGPVELRKITDALLLSRGGDPTCANLRLAFAGLPRVPGPQDLSTRLSMADLLMANGVSAEDLMRALNLDDDCAKYDPEQPRVPAGSGRDSGRWTADGGMSGASDPAGAGTMAVALRTAPLLAPELGATALSALSGLAASVGFAATLGLLFVPSPNAVSTSGPLPGDTGNSYDYNHDEGLLRVLDAAGVVLAAGHKDSSGVFFDADTGVPFARSAGGSLVFDGAAMAAANGSDDAESVPRALPRTETDEREPKLCPDPGADQPGSESASERAQKYQEQISRMINPQRPLEYGLAMNLVNPLSGKVVHYDECDEKTGTMIEAKGPGFDQVLSFPQGAESVTVDWLRQSLTNVEAAGSRQVVWYFAERQAAEVARQLFLKRGEGRQNIVIRVQPAEFR